MNNIQAVILAAGKGLRMRPATKNTPKPLVGVHDQPLIDHAIDSLPDIVNEIIVVVGYKKQIIEDHIKTEWPQRNITCVEQTPVDGTGSALHCAKKLLQGSVLVINSDDLYSQEDLARLCGYNASILTKEVSHNANIRSVVCDEQHNFLRLSRTPPEPQPMRQSCGAYVIPEDFFDTPLQTITTHNKTEYSLPDTLEVYAQQNPVKVVEADFWMPVGNPEQLAKAQNFLENNASRN